MNSKCKFKINKERKSDWVVGDNYFEPSYCLHTYSRATNGPGKILSYTTKSYLENLLSDKLNDQAFKNFINLNKNYKFNRQMLKQEIFNRGYSFKELSKSSLCFFFRFNSKQIVMFNSNFIYSVLI